MEKMFNTHAHTFIVSDFSEKFVFVSKLGVFIKTSKVIFFSILFFLCLSGTLRAQNVNVKTNLLYWATTTPNIGMEWRLSPKYTLSTVFGYNSFNFRNHTSSKGINVNPKLHHWVVMPEAKYWFCRAFERHYLGFHALYGQYNVGGLRFPAFLKDERYDGWGIGTGLSYGYQWAVGKYFGIELSLGVGYVYMNYEKYACGACGEKLGRFNRHYFGPTKVSASFIYYIR